MKKYFVIACIAAVVLTACNNTAGGNGGSNLEGNGKAKTTISDCHPDLNDLFEHGSAQAKAMKAVADEDISESVSYYYYMLSVKCTGENAMHIVYYDPEHICCMTPHSECTRKGNVITFNAWDTGLEACDCYCPRRSEADMTDLPYGNYTFVLQHEGEEKYKIDIEFKAVTDTLVEKDNIFM